MINLGQSLAVFRLPRCRESLNDLLHKSIHAPLIAHFASGDFKKSDPTMGYSFAEVDDGHLQTNLAALPLCRQF